MLGYKGPPIGNGLWGIEWSYDRWRHVTLKGQTRDPDMLYLDLENSWTYTRDQTEEGFSRQQQWRQPAGTHDLVGRLNSTSVILQSWILQCLQSAWVRHATCWRQVAWWHHWSTPFTLHETNLTYTRRLLSERFIRANTRLSIIALRP